jgi:hypothetical protein
MKLKTLLAIVALALLGSGGVRAAPIVYDGTLALGVPVTGSTTGFSYFLDDGANVNFWRVFLTAGEVVSISATRLNQNLNPAFDFYLGTTSADTSAFVDGTSWGGLTLLASVMDNVPAPAPGTGPGGDPFLSDFVARTTGFYTVAVGGFLSSDDGPYPYRIEIVPTPGTVPLLLVGLVGLIFTRRRLRH